MAVVSRRVDALAKRLGIENLVGREQVQKALEKDAFTVAQIIQEALNRQIEQILSTSASGSLRGYYAKIEVPKFEKLVLPRSGVELSGKYKYLVFVEAPQNHKARELNVFDIIDSGRPALPRRDPKAGQSPYPLWNTPSKDAPARATNARITESGSLRSPTSGKFTIARRSPARDPIIRKEPRSSAYENADFDDLVFVYGPLAAVPAKFLYKRALESAKDTLSGSGFDLWDVIYVGPKPEAVNG